jgi:hypothetical protein
MDINGCGEDFLDGSLKDDNDLGIRVMSWVNRSDVRGLAIELHLRHPFIKNWIERKETFSRMESRNFRREENSYK